MLLLWEPISISLYKSVFFTPTVNVHNEKKQRNQPKPTSIIEWQLAVEDFQTAKTFLLLDPEYFYI